MINKIKNINFYVKKNHVCIKTIFMVIPIFCLSQFSILALTSQQKVSFSIHNLYGLDAILNDPDGKIQNDKSSLIEMALILEKLTGLNYEEIITNTSLYRNIQIVGEDEELEAYLIVFNNNGGYVIFDNDKMYSTDVGNFEYLISTNYVTNNSGEILFLDENGHTYLVESTSGNLLSYGNNSADINIYDNVDGGIRDNVFNDYMSEQHPSWSLVETRQLGNYQRNTQFATSFYWLKKTFKNGDVRYWYSEGNCAVNAMSNYFLNLPYVTTPSGRKINYNERFSVGNVLNNRYSIFSSMSDVFSYQYTDNDYPVNEASTGKSDSEICINEHYQLRLLSSKYRSKDKDTYWFVRTESIKKGFDPANGFVTRSYGEYVMEKVANDYFSTNLDVYYTTSFSDVISNLNSGIPVVFSAQGSKYYGNHGMVIYGYKKYKYEETKLGFLWIPYTVTNYSYMWLVDDNWSSGDSTWYDSSKSTNNVFLCTERSSLLWPSC